MQMQLLDQFDRTVNATFVITRANVTMLLKGQIVGDFPRQQLENFLVRPEGEIADARTILMAVPNGVALAVADAVPMWPLREQTLLRLRCALGI